MTVAVGGLGGVMACTGVAVGGVVGSAVSDSVVG